MKDRQKTNVVFRKYPDGEIVALFPHEKWNLKGTECACYHHIGQHGGAEYEFVINRTVPATEAEYKELFEELEERGYNLAVFGDDKMLAAMKRECDNEQEIKDLFLAFRFMEITSDKGRKITFNSAVKHMGVYSYVAILYRATYHCTSEYVDLSYTDDDIPVGIHYNFRHTGWGK